MPRRFLFRDVFNNSKHSGMTRTQKSKTNPTTAKTFWHHSTPTHVKITLPIAPHQRICKTERKLCLQQYLNCLQVQTHVGGREGGNGEILALCFLTGSLDKHSSNLPRGSIVPLPVTDIEKVLIWKRKNPNRPGDLYELSTVL